MNCPDCGNPVTAEDHFCPKCYSIIQPPTLWQKFLALFRPKVGRKPREAASVKKIATVTTTQVTTTRGGERHVYKSIDEVPADQRPEIERLRDLALSGKGQKIFTVRDASGQERTYHSLDEMPAKIRALLEKMQGGSK